MKLPHAVSAAALAGCALILAAPACGPANQKRIALADLADKIAGGWAGQMIAVSFGAPTEFRSLSAIIEGDMKYEDGRVELFNLRDDVGERFDLAASMPDKTRELRQDLAAWRRATGAQMPVPVPGNYDPRLTEEWKRSRNR